MSRTGQSCRHSSNHPTETHHILGVAKKQVLSGQILSRLRHSNRKWASWSRVLVGILCFLDAAFVQRVRDCKRGCDHKKEANRNIENKPGSPFCLAFNVHGWFWDNVLQGRWRGVSRCCVTSCFLGTLMHFWLTLRTQVYTQRTPVNWIHLERKALKHSGNISPG